MRAVVLAFAALAAAGVRPVQAQDAPTSFGHRAYREADSATLRAIGRYRATSRVVMLAAPAAAAFNAMRAAAAADSITLVPVSGFRSFDYERNLFERATQRYGSPELAARWVAPAGYTEHHTGLAIDIGDDTRPACDTETCFADTRAARWLFANAARFGFELSFPEHHGVVSYEPWHYRFVGDSTSRAVFAPDAAR